MNKHLIESVRALADAQKAHRAQPHHDRPAFAFLKLANDFSFPALLAALERAENNRAKLAIAIEALSAVDSQAVCGGMDGPDGDYKMIEHCEEIATTALCRINELEKKS